MELVQGEQSLLHCPLEQLVQGMTFDQLTDSEEMSFKELQKTQS